MNYKMSDLFLKEKWCLTITFIFVCIKFNDNFVLHSNFNIVLIIWIFVQNI